MHKLNNLGLLAPEGETGATGAVSDQQSIFENTDTGSNETPGEFGSANEPVAIAGSERSETAVVSPATAQAAPSTVNMTHEQLETLATRMVSAMPRAAQPQAQQQAQPVTAEQQAEFDRQFNVVRVTPEMFRNVFGVDGSPEQLKAMEGMLHNVARMSNAMVNYQVQQEIQRREQGALARVQPALDYVQRVEAQNLETEFFTKHADIKEFPSLVQEVIGNAKANNVRFADKSKAMDYVATRVRDLLTKARGGLPPPKQQSGTRKHTMPAVSTGGRTGSNNGSQQPVSGPQAVFGGMDA